MAKLSMELVLKYLAIGAGAVAIPTLLGSFGANIPGFDYAIYSGITVGMIVMAGLGAGVVDQLFFNR